MKRCGHCHKELPESEFCKNQHWCRKCKKEYNKKYITSPEGKAVRAKYCAKPKVKAYKLKHSREYNVRPEVKIAHAKYAKTPKVKEAQAKYAATPKRKAARAKYAATIRGKYATCKKNAKNRGIEFNLTLNQFAAITMGKCTYCPHIGFHGLDRVDSSKGYTKDNVVPSCTPCNYAKHIQTQEEFKEATFQRWKWNLTESTINIRNSIKPTDWNRVYVNFLYSHLSSI